MTPGPHRLKPRDLLLGLLVMAALLALLATDDPTIRAVALCLLALVPVTHVTSLLAHSLRSGRVSGTTRADQPAAYWSAMTAILLLDLLFVAALVLALQD